MIAVRAKQDTRPKKTRFYIASMIATLKLVAEPTFPWTHTFWNTLCNCNNPGCSAGPSCSELYRARAFRLRRIVGWRIRRFQAWFALHGVLEQRHQRCGLARGHLQEKSWEGRQLESCRTLSEVAPTTWSYQGNERDCRWPWFWFHLAAGTDRGFSFHELASLKESLTLVFSPLARQQDPNRLISRILG